MSRYSDIEDFTEAELDAEIRRRRRSLREGLCWYCRTPLASHTCKYAADAESIDANLDGWDFEAPSFLDGEDCMGNRERYWRTSAVNPGLGGAVVMGTGPTAAEATAACLANLIRGIQAGKFPRPAGKSAEVRS